MGVQEPITFEYPGYYPVDVLDIRPDEHDPDHALVVHLPMANGLDSNQQYQAATLAGTNPNIRVIAVGNPGGNSTSGKLSHSQRKSVAHGNFAPTIDPVIKYLELEGVQTVDAVGYSYGANKAVAMVERGPETHGAVFVEPVVGKRSMIRLARDFASTDKALAGYVQANQLPTFEAARRDSVGAVVFTLGLARLSNLAIASGLARGEFDMDLRDAQSVQPNMSPTLVWGTRSELATDDVMRLVAEEARANSLRLPNQRHALANDLHLMSAIAREALTR